MSYKGPLKSLGEFEVVWQRKKRRQSLLLLGIGEEGMNMESQASCVWELLLESHISPMDVTSLSCRVLRRKSGLKQYKFYFVSMM